ncbi:TPA: hypothetical protein TUW61_000347 [Streptococcus equi subsp. zooepidemicus]|uniref:hypothetical protein n=1 Tax=Streptococcus equi TaxID=1336 RepID=UPI0018A224E7|nr:hypothetical protein [Streptococcus equi]MCD3413685.1 hypothetical protein [Streptococcus equi subsp. zooepidemicus]MCD3431160.1 hypothetical protein [Streptococcus equi subsp. zooepidemicus]HEL0569498.1 hypothetical protein [Streptococcus equi subsp. zooepidemicus]HEL0666297.1 hypothetical protein [Streptococcus equi subsp. zooepidemicus]HEL0672000.1 hypothetical protein [Streptococcus equi subsp. zooepidemicus]
MAKADHVASHHGREALVLVVPQRKVLTMLVAVILAEKQIGPLVEAPSMSAPD